MITAVQSINRTIEEENPVATLASLQQDAVKLNNVLPENALLYQAVLYAEKQEKKKVRVYSEGGGEVEGLGPELFMRSVTSPGKPSYLDH